MKPDKYLSTFTSDGSLKRELEIFNQTEHTLNSLFIQQALKSQAEENRRIGRKNPSETEFVRATMTSTTAEPVSDEDLELFKGFYAGRRGLKSQKQDWPELNTLVSHHLFVFFDHYIKEFNS